MGAPLLFARPTTSALPYALRAACPGPTNSKCASFAPWRGTCPRCLRSACAEKVAIFSTPSVARQGAAPRVGMLGGDKKLLSRSGAGRRRLGLREQREQKAGGGGGCLGAWTNRVVQTAQSRLAISLSQGQQETAEAPLLCLNKHADWPRS
jgi:hypothetical protein